MGNPIAWRDIATRSYGPLVSLSKWGYLLLFGCLLLMAIAGVFREDEASLAFSFLFWMAGIGLGCLLSAASLAGERRSDTLSVLSVSTLSSSRILLGKLQGVLFHVGPLLFLGAFFGALYQLDNLRGGGPWASEFGPLLFYRVPGIQGLAIGAWLVAFGGALLICCQAVGLWIRPRLALPAVLVAPILFGVAAGLLTVLDERLMELVMYLLIPLLNGGVWSRHPGVPPEMLISTLAWATLGTAVFAFEVVTLRSRA